MYEVHSNLHRTRPATGGSVASAEISDVCWLVCERSRDPVVVFDRSGHCVAANGAAASLLGYDQTEFLSLNLIGLVVRDGQRPGQAPTGIEDLRAWSGTITVRRRGGAILLVDAWGAELPSASDATILLFLREAGNRSRWTPPGTRLADSRASDEPCESVGRSPSFSLAHPDDALDGSESDASFRAAFFAAPIGMALVNPTGRFLTVNPALCAMLGYSEDVLLASTLPGITVAADLDTDEELARQLLAGDIDSYQVEKRYLRRDGETIWGRLTIALVRDPEHAPLYFVAQVQDITPYKAFGAALREAEARYRTLVEQIPAVLYVDAGDSLGTPIYISPQVERLLGFTPDEWLATPDHWIAHVHPDDRDQVTSALASANEAGDPMNFEYRLIAQDESTVWVRDQLALVRDETGARRYWQGFMVDVTARKRVEEELRAALAAAEEANRLKSAFLSMATHELRTPLTVISGYMELLADSATANLGIEEQEFLDIVRTSAKTLAALVDDLLDLARIEAGKMELVIRPVNIAEAVDRVSRMVRGQAITKGVALEVNVARGLPPVAADLNRLNQILLNLFGNAVKFTDVGRVRCIVRLKGKGVEIRVIDTGIGIPAEALPRIFDEFRQADAGTTRKFGGSGLGLAIAKRLVEMQGGTIAAKSKVGVGSTFTLWLPAATAQLICDDHLDVDSSASASLTLVPS